MIQVNRGMFIRLLCPVTSLLLGDAVSSEGFFKGILCEVPFLGGAALLLFYSVGAVA